MVRFPDIPEAITQGESVEDALTEAADALEEALIGKLTAGGKIPVPSPAKTGQYRVPVSAETQRLIVGLAAQ